MSDTTPFLQHPIPDHPSDTVYFEAISSNPKLWNTTTRLLPKRRKLFGKAATEFTVRSSLDCVQIVMLIPRAEIASSMHEIEIEKDKIKSDPAKLSVLFKEMIQMCLWCVFPPIGFSYHPTNIIPGGTRRTFLS